MASVKWQNLPFAVKLEIIESNVVRSQTLRQRARFRGAPILKNKAEIRDKADKRPGARGAQRVRTAVYEDVEAAVYKWFVDVRLRNLPVSGPMIEQKAKDMAFLLGREDFQGGSGWLQRFKERHEKRRSFAHILRGDWCSRTSPALLRECGRLRPRLLRLFRPC